MACTSKISTEVVMKSFAVVLGLLLCGGCGVAASPHLNDPNLKIADVRGDSLGMTLKDYEKKHPRECSGQTCVARETYAGISALKSANFTRDGRLYQVSYSAPPEFANELLTALKEKYGDPGCSAREKESCLWSNGMAHVRYSNFVTGVSVEFTDETLAAQAGTEYERDRAKARKADQ